ncbi:MAG: DUF86 domain-containing protein [Desulfarculus sp.]|nr:DUF86 domain-containing protein [Desulfarculus sp.]
MPLEPRDAAYLWDMLDAAEAVAVFVAGRSYQEYLADRMLRGAVERHLEIIGEAANKVSQACHEGHPQIPWRQIIAQRHVLIHDYGEVQHDLVWKVATFHVPALIEALKELLPSPPGAA